MTARALVGAVERPGHDWVGQDIGVGDGRRAARRHGRRRPAGGFCAAHAVIDFTAPAATVEFAASRRAGALRARDRHDRHDEDDLARIEAAARHATIVRAGNMSLGVNLLVQLTRKVAAALDEDYDIEVIEAHHNQKVDAPSGTALMLGEAAAQGAACPCDDVADRGPRRHHRQARARAYRLFGHPRRGHRGRA